jgi:tetratricopeptide (TPR) repeat protein
MLGFLIYSHTLEAPFYFDDGASIQSNRHIRLSQLTVKDMFRSGVKSPCSNRPIANMSFALNYYFHQYDVAGYHAVNIVIHVVTAILLYLFIRTTFMIPWLSARHKPQASIAFFAAVLWLVHPIQSQSVTYIVQRMNSLAAMFYILSFLLYVKARLVKEGQKRWPWFSGCVLAGILALGSKEIAATLPFFILLYEWYFFQDLSKAWLKRHLPYIVGLLVLFGLLALLYFGANPLQAILSGYKHRDFTLTQRALTQFRVVIHYISLLFYPHPSRLNLDYDFPLSLSLIEPITTLFSMAAIVGLIGLAIYLGKRERLLSFCILWFFGNLVIESSVIGLEVVYEHRAYLPSMSFFLLVTIVIYRCIRADWAVAGLLCGAIAWLCLWTYERNRVWTDPVALWTDCVAKSPGKARPYNNLALALHRQGGLNEAIAHYRQALRIRPEYVAAHLNLGVALEAQGRLDEAVQHYTETLRIRSEDPSAHTKAHTNMGGILARQGKLDEAIRHYLAALEIRPDYARAHNNLGVALDMQGRVDEAVIHYSEALKSEPLYADAHNNLGLVLASQGKLDEAIAHYWKALKTNPLLAEPHHNLGVALQRKGRLDEASAHFSTALRIRPGYAAARQRLLRLGLRQAGEQDEASGVPIAP